MAGFSAVDKVLFPLRNTDAVVALFREHLEERKEPNLALLSIVLGALESSLTVNRQIAKQPRPDGTAQQRPGLDVTSAPHSDEPAESKENPAAETAPSKRCRDVHPLPAVQLSVVEALYEKFVTVVKGSVDLSSHTKKYTDVALLKKASDVIWCSLSRTFYKDRPHLQSIFTLLTECKLDSFGMAISVIAACQALGLTDVHLALSEDHAWAVFGDPSNQQTAEITWHGKGSEDRRGQPVVCSSSEKSWLYMSPVICTRHMEVAAMVTAINPAINSTTDSLDMCVLQQKLLWILYDLGHLDRYPASLATLADIEEANPTAGRLSSLTLYSKAIESGRRYYSNSHIYPYTYLGNCQYRRTNYKEALHCWANAARVISRFNYNREDEEAYKEFLEIANELIPNVMRAASTPAAEQTGSDSRPALLTSDPECYAYVLQFYDGLCEWEEGSSMPVLHITWATHALQSLNRFEAAARTNLTVKNAFNRDEAKSDDGSVTVPVTRKPKRVSEEGTRPSRSGRHQQKRISLASTAEDSNDGSSTTTETDRRSALESDDSNDSHRERRNAASEKSGSEAKPEEGLSERKEGSEVGGVELTSTGAVLVLRSEKMMGMKDLLVADRLNSGAIKLQLTAQSQVYFKPSRGGEQAASVVESVAAAAGGPRKRIRRE